MKKILIAGYHGYYNSGDDAILYAICKDIHSLDIPCDITILSNDPAMTQKEYGEKAIGRFDFFKVCQQLGRTDVLLMGGGSLLQDNTSTRSLLYYLFLIGYAKLRRKKVFLYANGIGPLHSRFNQKLTRWIANKIDLITLREPQSLELLKKIKVNRPEVHITADPVYQLESGNNHADEVLREAGIEEGMPITAVFFRSWSNERETVIKIAEICDRIREDYGMSILIIPMKYPADLNVSMEIAKMMKQTPVVLHHKIDVSTMIEIISRAKLVLSMRLHALIYASINAIPMIGFVYDPKVDYFIKELHAFSAGDIHHFEPSKVLEYVDEILKDYEQIQGMIGRSYLELRQKAYENRVHLKKLLKS